MEPHPKRLRLLLVDDHFVVRMGLAAALSLEPDFEVIGECGTARQALLARRPPIS